MTVAAAALWSYDLPLSRPLAARDGGRRRQGFVLRLTDAAGRAAWGEAAPLPVHGTGSAEAVADGLRRAVAVLPGLPLADSVAGMAATLRARLGALALPPAATCAVEAAALGLAAARQGVALQRLLWRQALDEVAVAGLVDRGGTARDAADAVAALARAGHRVVKLKVGDAGDGARLRAAQAAVPGVRFRLDANRGWHRDAARAAMAGFAATGAAVEFVEEPLDGGGLLPDAPLPQALDDSLAGLGEAEAVALMDRWRPAAVVLKPMVLGYLAAHRLAAAAEARGIAAVISSSFETGLGLRLAAALAAGGQAAAGLGTARWFAADLVAQPDPARIDLRAAPVPDKRLLEPLDVAA